MPGLDALALAVVATLGPTTVLGANLIYLGTLASASSGAMFIPWARR